MQAIKGLCPIRNFGELEKGKLYRGAQPLYSYEFQWLKDKGVKNLINLRSERHIDDKYNELFAAVYNIDIPDHGIPTPNDIEFFGTILSNGECAFFHCEHGRGRTSVFAVIARLTMGWTLQKALDEEESKFGYTFQHPKQLEFLQQLNKVTIKL